MNLVHHDINSQLELIKRDLANSAPRQNGGDEMQLEKNSNWVIILFSIRKTDPNYVVSRTFVPFKTLFEEVQFGRL